MLDEDAEKNAKGGKTHGLAPLSYGLGNQHCGIDRDGQP